MFARREKLLSLQDVLQKSHKFEIGEAHQLRPDYNWIINATGQLVELGERSEIRRFCSGFNIGQGYFLTAGHCLSKHNVCYIISDEAKDVSNLRVTFDYEYTYNDILRQHILPFNEKSYPVRVVDHGGCNIRANFDFTETEIGAPPDYAVFQLDPQAISRYPSVTLTKDVPDKWQEVVVAHHPKGTAKKVSFGHVQDSSLDVVDYTAFTLGGSSGSPVAYDDTLFQRRKEVFAVHVAGHVKHGEKTHKHHWGITVNQIASVAKEHEKDWVYNLGLFKRPAPSYSDQQLILYSPPRYNFGCCS